MDHQGSLSKGHVHLLPHLDLQASTSLLSPKRKLSNRDRPMEHSHHRNTSHRSDCTPLPLRTGHDTTRGENFLNQEVNLRIRLHLQRVIPE